MAYDIEGRLLEVCDCKVICPCWVGEDPDNGTCEGTIAWHIDQGTINDVDVAGRTIAVVAHIPGNVLEGEWQGVLFIDDGSTDEQQDALLQAFGGQLGGPIADLVSLVGEVKGVERAPIQFTVRDGKGTLKIGATLEANVEPYIGPHGDVTTLNESVFSTIPGSPAYVSKAESYWRKTSEKYDLNDVDLQDHNAVQGVFRFQA